MIIYAVQAELGLSGMLEVDGRLRGAAVSWLRYASKGEDGGTAPTVHDALFSDVYH
jgi:hypothetical protein